MSYLYYHQSSRLSDARQRDLTRNALSCSEQRSAFSAVRKAFSATKKGILAISAFIGEVADAMNEARAHDAFYMLSRHS